MACNVVRAYLEIGEKSFEIEAKIDPVEDASAEHYNAVAKLIQDFVDGVVANTD